MTGTLTFVVVPKDGVDDARLNSGTAAAMAAPAMCGGGLVTTMHLSECDSSG